MSDCFTFSLEIHIFVSFNTKRVKEYIKKEINKHTCITIQLYRPQKHLIKLHSYTVFKIKLNMSSRLLTDCKVENTLWLWKVIHTHSYFFILHDSDPHEYLTISVNRIDSRSDDTTLIGTFPMYTLAVHRVVKVQWRRFVWGYLYFTIF